MRRFNPARKIRSQIDAQADTQADKHQTGGDREGMSDRQDEADGRMIRWRRKRRQLERQTGGG